MVLVAVVVILGVVCRGSLVVLGKRSSVHWPFSAMIGRWGTVPGLLHLHGQELQDPACG